MTSKDVLKQNQKIKASIEEAISLAQSMSQKDMLIDVLKIQIFRLLELQVQHATIIENTEEFIKQG